MASLFLKCTELCIIQIQLNSSGNLTILLENFYDLPHRMTNKIRNDTQLFKGLPFKKKKIGEAK